MCLTGTQITFFLLRATSYTICFLRWPTTYDTLAFPSWYYVALYFVISDTFVVTLCSYHSRMFVPIGMKLASSSNRSHCPNINCVSHICFRNVSYFCTLYGIRLLDPEELYTAVILSLATALRKEPCRFDGVLYRLYDAHE